MAERERGRRRDDDEDEDRRGRDRDEERGSRRSRDDDDDDRGSRRSGRDDDDDRRGKMRDKDRGGFKYRGREARDVKERAEQQGGAFDSVVKSNIPTWRPKVGFNQVRIMPPTWEDTEKWGKHYGIDVWLHRNIGADNGTYLCAKKMEGKSCILCEARGDMDETDADAIKPARTVAVWIIDRDDEKAGPQVWLMSWTIDKDIAARCVNRKTGAIELIDDPEKGFDVEFNRDGQGFKTKYNGIAIARDPTPLADRERDQEEWLQYIQDHPLPEILNYFDQEYIDKVFGGKVHRKDEDLDDDRRGRRGGRGKDKDKDDDDDRGSRRSRGRDRDDDDDDDRRGSRRSLRDEVDEDRGSRRGRKDEDEDEDKGKSRGRGKDKDLDDEIPGRGRGDDDEAPRGRERRSRDDDDDEPRRRRGKDKDDDDDDDKGKDKPSSTRERLKDLGKRR